MRDIKDTIKLVCGYLNKEGIEYVLVGGLAVIIYGIPRTTMDMDIVLKIPKNKIEGLVDFLKKNDFFADKEDMKIAFDERTHCTVQDKKSMVRLDIKGIYNEMDIKTLRNRVPFDYDGERIYIASIEDTIANKLYFKREQDIKDAEGIYVRQLEKLDMKYLENRCKSLGIYNDFKKLKKRVEKYL